MRTLAIAGVGLIGGSFALALRRAGFAGRILGVSSERTIRQALALGVIDEGVALAEAAARADLIYLSQPIRQILETIRALGAIARPDCLITDAGSTKEKIVGAAEQSLPPGIFLGGHPMAGKESRGVAAAEASLFEGRTYVLAPRNSRELEAPAMKELRFWIDRIGAVTVVMDPAAHDRAVSLVSHLPQLISTALGAALVDKLDALERRAAGPGLLDMTRLALSPYDVWRDIIATNPARIAEALDAYIEELRQLRAGLEDPSMERRFRRAARLAASIRDDAKRPPTS